MVSVDMHTMKEEDAGIDWVKLYVSQRMARGQFDSQQQQTFAAVTVSMDLYIQQT